MYSALACMFQEFAVARNNELSKASFIWAVGISVAGSSSASLVTVQRNTMAVSKMFKIN